MTFWNNPITNFITGFWTIYLNVRYLFFAVIFFGFVSMSLYNGYNKWEAYDNQYNVDAAPLHIGISASNKCSFLVNAETLEVVKFTSDLVTPEQCQQTMAPENIRNLVTLHSNSIRGINSNPEFNFWVCYVVGFIVFMGMCYINTSHYNILVHPTRTLVRYICGWLVISMLIFPISYGNYSAVAKINHNGMQYMTGSYKQIDENHWVFYNGSNVGRWTRIADSQPSTSRF